MKQKINNNAPVTKIELSDILKDYPTKKDLQNALKESEQKFTKRLLESQKAFRRENNHNFQVMMARFDERFSKFTNLILTAIDPLIKDIETRREDREIATAQMKRIEDDVDTLKKQVSQLQHS